MMSSVEVASTTPDPVQRTPSNRSVEPLQRTPSNRSVEAVQITPSGQSVGAPPVSAGRESLQRTPSSRSVVPPAAAQARSGAGPSSPPAGAGRPDRNKVQARRQQFVEQWKRLEGELQEVRLRDAPAVSASVKARQIARLQYRMAEVCAQYFEYERAIECLNQVLVYVNGELNDKTEAAQSNNPTDSIDEPQQNGGGGDGGDGGQGGEGGEGGEAEATEAASPAPQSEDDELVLQADNKWLKETVLNNLAVLHFRVGKQKEALSFLLEAKRLMREGEVEPEADTYWTGQLLDRTMTVNYALFLHAKGSVDDAIYTADAVVETFNSRASTSVQDESAHVTALSLLAACYRSRDTAKSFQLALQAAERSDAIAKSMIQSRTHNNLGTYYVERGDLHAALDQFLIALRATQAAQDFRQQAVVKYHIGVVAAALEAIVDLPLTARNDTNNRRMSSLSTTTDEPTTVPTSARECFAQSEGVGGLLPLQDPQFHIMLAGCRAECAYYSGDFPSAAVDFNLALKRLTVLLELSDKARSSSDRLELLRLQGYLSSYLGSTYMVDGKFEFAEAAHQRDLDMALENEDIHAQMRAMRNLALVATVAQRYREAFNLWRDCVETATVIQSKSDLMASYAGLGSAIRACKLADTKGEFSEELKRKENNALQIFLKQRAVAIEAGDKEQHIVAQRLVVSTYESSEQGISEMEQRLIECDTFVRLCETYPAVSYRADAYRMLANALTAQIGRLASRGPRFAEAVRVLTMKRDSVSTKYKQAMQSLALAEGQTRTVSESADKSALTLSAPGTRPALTNVEVFQRL